MSPQTFTTAEAAKKAGISRQTLHTWMTEGLVTAPKPVMIGQREFRFWTQQDINRLKTFRGSLRPGPKAKKGKKP